MLIFSRTIVSRLLLAGLLTPLAASSLLAQTSVRTVKVLGSKDAVEIEVEASDRIIPQTQVLTGPDRLVIDFPNSVPSDQLHSQSVDRGEVKDIRVGRFQSKPPVTRVVLDLKTAQSYQVFPNGRTVIIKVMGGGVSSDTGRQQGLDLLKAGYAKGQMSGAIGIMQQDIAARVWWTPVTVRPHGSRTRPASCNHPCAGPVPPRPPGPRRPTPRVS